VKSPLEVVLIHRDRLSREALAFALSQQADIRVVRVVPQVSELSADDKELDVSLFVVHLDVPRREGLAQARVISACWPLAAILMIGVTVLEPDIIACCESGASGYLVEDSSLATLIGHVRAVGAGNTPCSPDVAALLFTRLRERTRELRALQLGGAIRLTRREIEIIALIDQRLSNKEIAVRLGIEVQTVKNHVHNLLEKLEVRGRADAVRFARERGLLSTFPPPVDVHGPRAVPGRSTAPAKGLPSRV
jgi:two-component system nitrate/nitrite response regulator NarL